MKRCIDFKPTLGAYDIVLRRDADVSKCASAPMI